MTCPSCGAVLHDMRGQGFSVPAVVGKDRMCVLWADGQYQCSAKEAERRVRSPIEGDAIRLRKDGSIEKLETGVVFEVDVATGKITSIG